MKQNYLCAFILALTLSIAGSAQCLSGWGYLQPITITNSLAVPLTNFQVKVTVNTAAPIGAGEMNASGNDIRFQTTGCGKVNYWIESGINTTATSIWLKVPSLPASGSTTVNMYYGNPFAAAESAGDSVFLFFDDFNDGVFSTAKWNVRGTPSVLQETGGVLQFQGNSNWEYIRSTTTWNGAVVIESSEYAANTPAVGMVLGYAGTDERLTFREGNTGLKGTTYDPDVSGSNSWQDMNYPNVQHPLSGYNTFSLQTDFVSNRIVINSFCNINTSNCNTNQFTFSNVTGTGYYVGFSSFSGGFIQYVDWIRVRSHASQQPATTVGAQQPNAGITSTASFSVICAGSNATVSFNANGTFNAGNIFTAELSDATGSFAAPVTIGTLASNNTGPQSMSVTIPSNASGTQYRVRVNSSNVAVTGANNGSNLVINALPNVVATATPTEICAGAPGTLVVTGASTYVWSHGPTSSTIIVSPSVSSTYTVTGTDMNGCTANASVMITVNPLPVVNITGNTMLCEGTSDSLWVSGASMYAWSTMETTESIEIMPLSTTTYSVNGTDIHGCESQAQITVTVMPLPVLSISVGSLWFCASDGATALNATPAGGAWSGTGVTGMLFDPAAANIGMNTVLYTYTDSLSGCSASDSLEIYVDFCLNTPGSIAQNNLKLYPNPNNGTFTMQSASAIGYFEITDALGRVVYTAIAQSTQATVAVEGLAPGMYVVRAQGTVIRFSIER